MLDLWKSLGLPEGTLVHLLYEPLESKPYHHARYLKTFVERAGLRCKFVDGLAQLSFKDGLVVD